jgi:hypothetical protein
MISIIIIIILLIVAGTVGYFFYDKMSKEAEAEAEAEVEAEVEALFTPPFDGMVGWYDGNSLKNNTLLDKSSNKNDVTNIKGELIKIDNYLSGTIDTKIIFPENILPSTFTFIHVSRYSGVNRRRIFSSTKNNSLSGFWGNNTGVSYYEDWKTEKKNNVDSNWLLSVDSNDFYRGNGTDFTIKATGEGTQIAINEGKYPKETSDFEIAEMIIYERVLEDEEIEMIERYLTDKYDIN